MTKYIGAALIAAVVGDCAHTTTGFREQAPKFEAMSNKKPEMILGCITQAWGWMAYTKTYTPMTNGGSVALDVPTFVFSTGNKIGIVDAETVSDHTRVRFYGFNMFRKNDNEKVLSQAKACL